MTKQKSTKRALLTSALALLVCVSMLVGSTFAWFTDSVTSSGNIIKSGTLDVTMEWKDATTTGAQKTYKDASQGAIFNYDKWEPGYVEAKNIKIGNNGTLALKYALNILANGEVSILADVIDVYFAEGEYTLKSRDLTKLTNVGTLADILKKMPSNTSGDLLAGETDTVTIALKMQESADNKYQGLSIGSEFAIQLLATQLTYESDSFNNQYDALAGETHFMANGVNYTSFDEAVKNATPDANGVVTYFIGGDAVFSGGWDAPIAPAGTTKVVIKGTGAETASLNLAHTYRNSLHADGMIVEISDITIDCDPCGIHQDTRNIWVCANELYATNVVFMDPADASNVKVAVFDGCTFASATADEEPSNGNYQLWVGDHDANYGSVTESVTVKNSVFESGKRAIKLAPTTGSTSYTAVIDNNIFYDITNKPAVCLNYGTQANTVTITNNTLYNTDLVEDEVNGNYTEINNTLIKTVAVANDEELASALKDSDVDVIYLASGNYGVIDVTVNRNLTITAAAGADVKIAGIDGQSNNNSTNVTIKGVTIDNSLQTEGWYTGTAKNIKPCVGVWGGNYTFENCTFYVTGASGAETGVMSWWTTNKGVMNFTDCTFNGGNGSARAMQIYGHYDLNVTNCTFNTAKDYSIKYVGESGTKATFKNNTVNATTNFVQTGSAPYAGANYSLVFDNNTLAAGIKHIYVDNAEGQTITVNGTAVEATKGNIY